MRRPCIIHTSRRPGGFPPPRSLPCCTRSRHSMGSPHPQAPGETRGFRAVWSKEKDMSYEKIVLDLSDGIATITFNRPEAFNALDMQLAREFHDAIVMCSEDDAV